MLLQITRSEIFLVRIPMRFVIKHALASRTANTSGFLVLYAADGSMGIGEFLCRDYVTGETSEDVTRYLKRLTPFIMNTPVEDPRVLIESLWQAEPTVPGQSGALCALDLALLDLWGKQHRKPVAEML